MADVPRIWLQSFGNVLPTQTQITTQLIRPSTNLLFSLKQLRPFASWPTFTSFGENVWGKIDFVEKSQNFRPRHDRAQKPVNFQTYSELFTNRVDSQQVDSSTIGFMQVFFYIILWLEGKWKLALMQPGFEPVSTPWVVQYLTSWATLTATTIKITEQ